MSTDSTELTFIRCPSCRSLVPAVSPRCRMCGAVLDAGKADAAGEKDNNKKVPARVRQQTVQVSDRDVNEAKHIFAEPEPSKNREVAEASNQSKAAYQPESFVPSYQEEDAEIEELLQSASSQESRPTGSKVEDSIVNENDFTDYGDPLGAFIEEVPVEDSINEAIAKEEGDPSNGNGYHMDPFSEPDVENVEAQPSQAEDSFDYTPSPESQKPAEVTPPVPVNEPRSRVVIESGQRRSAVPRGAGQKSGLSFGRGRTEPAPVKEPSPAVAAQASQVEKAPPAVQPSSPVTNPVAARKVADKGEPSEVEAAESSASSRPVVASPKPASDSVKGRLNGWLVSYSDPKGVANELREGKFFVSRSSLKGSDLILDDDSISTPHALFAVNASDGLRVQDLMSDRGVFVRRRTGEAYQRVLESTKLEHGDWVRFGDVEFLVAIIS